MPEIISPQEYFIQLLESQRDINTHIHSLEPSTPIYLFEIDLTDIKPASKDYENLSGPIKKGILRIHNDFNLFNINRGVIVFGKDYDGNPNYYLPFPVYGEQFDITSNGTIPAPKLKISSQFLDDEYNSFFKYLKMQINELKDLAGAKVTRKKTFARYLPGDNFIGGVNPFQDMVDVPWASRDGDVLAVRTTKNIPSNSLVWAIYYPETSLTSNFADVANKAIFTSPKTDDSSQTIGNIKQNFYTNSSDHFRIIYSNDISSSPDINETFSSNIFVFDAKKPDIKYFFTNENYLKNIYDGNYLRYVVNKKHISGKNLDTGITNLQSIPFGVNIGLASGQQNHFISLRQRFETLKDFNYNKFVSAGSTGAEVLFSEPIRNPSDLFVLSINTGFFTGINPVSKETVNFVSLKNNHNFGAETSGNVNISLPLSFNTNPKIIFNVQASNSNLFFNYKISNISTTGLRLTCYNTGDLNTSLNIQNYQILMTDYIIEEGIQSGVPQVFNTVNNLGGDISNIDIRNVSSNELELTPDIYYIDRKSQEDKTSITYDLASLLDIEGVKLPSRLLLSKNCPFSYRGEGCLYEYGSTNIKPGRLTKVHSGIYSDVLGNCKVSDNDFNSMSITPIQEYQKAKGIKFAPPVADQNDRTFFKLEGSTINTEHYFNDVTELKDKEFWSLSATGYDKGDFIYIQKNNINYYFVCKTKHQPSAINSPPNTGYWISDACSKTLNGCRLRWRNNPNFSPSTISGVALITGVSSQNLQFVESRDLIYKEIIQAPLDVDGNQLIGILPFGGFPSVQGKYSSSQQA